MGFQLCVRYSLCMDESGLRALTEMTALGVTGSLISKISHGVTS